jgi:hypothetical protein
MKEISRDSKMIQIIPKGRSLKDKIFYIYMRRFWRIWYRNNKSQYDNIMKNTIIHGHCCYKIDEYGNIKNVELL